MMCFYIFSTGNESTSPIDTVVEGRGGNCQISQTYNYETNALLPQRGCTLSFLISRVNHSQLILWY